MKKLFFILCSLALTHAYASHIVGGEFELLHLKGSQYQVNLIYYFDVLNKGSFGTNTPESLEPTLTAYIYSKGDNHLIRRVVLAFVSPRTRVGYTQPACSDGQVVTDKLIYSTVIELDAATYNDPQGYYITWERCCRNYT